MPQSLHRTWAALAIAALAVLVVAILAGRDFLGDVYASCPGQLYELDPPLWEVRPSFEPVAMETVSRDRIATAAPVTSGPTFRVVHESPQKAPGPNEKVRVIWQEPGGDTGCTCGTTSIALSDGEAASDLRLYRERSSERMGGWDLYVVKVVDGSRSRERAFFTIDSRAARHFQRDRILNRQHLPLGIALFALGALVVALFRSRRAMSYALRLHRWTEARLTPGGLIESDTGAAMGTLEQTRMRPIPPGPVLVAPEALSTSGLYRDMPIVARRSVAEGTHARWAMGTMLRLRDARALAIISAACTLLALGARLIA